MNNSPPPQPPPDQHQPPAPEGQPQDNNSGSGVVTIIIHHSITVLILILVIGLVVWGYLNFQDTDFFATVDRDELDAKLYPPLEQAQQQRLETSLQVYSLVHNDHPVQLADLVDTGFLLHSDLYYPRGPDFWSYERHGDGFTLKPGPPQKPDSE